MKEPALQCMYGHENGFERRQADPMIYVNRSGGRTRFRKLAMILALMVLGAYPTFAGTAEWKDGDLQSYGQVDWLVSAGANLYANYDSTYASSAGIVEVGIPDPAGFSMRFDAASAVLAFLPAGGTAGPLTAGLSNPTTSASGIFGGQVLALRLNIDFSDAGGLGENSSLKFGDLTLCGFSNDPTFGDLPNLNGISVRQFSTMANTLLGGGSATYSIDQLGPITDEINSSFDGGVSPFARQHLVSGACL